MPYMETPSKAFLWLIVVYINIDASSLLWDGCEPMSMFPKTKVFVIVAILAMLTQSQLLRASEWYNIMSKIYRSEVSYKWIVNYDSKNKHISCMLVITKMALFFWHDNKILIYLRYEVNSILKYQNSISTLHVKGFWPIT